MSFDDPRIVGTIRHHPIETRRVDESVLFVPIDPLEAVEIERQNGQRLQIQYGISYVGFPSYDTFRLHTLAPDRRVLWKRLVELPNMGHTIFDLGDGFMMMPYGGRAKMPAPKDAPNSFGWMIRPVVPITEPILQVLPRDQAVDPDSIRKRHRG